MIPACSRKPLILSSNFYVNFSTSTLFSPTTPILEPMNQAWIQVSQSTAQGHEFYKSTASGGVFRNPIQGKLRRR